MHTVSNIDPNQHALKKKVWEAFHGEQLNCLNLKDRTKRSLIDFISCLPEMATKAATRSNIMHGFYECGLIDKDKSRFPVITKILSTCRSSISKDVYDKMINNFPLLYKTMLEQGQISDEVFDSLGFPKDTDVHGNEISRDAGISQKAIMKSLQQIRKLLNLMLCVKLKKSSYK